MNVPKNVIPLPFFVVTPHLLDPKIVSSLTVLDECIGCDVCNGLGIIKNIAKGETLCADCFMREKDKEYRRSFRGVLTPTYTLYICDLCGESCKHNRYYAPPNHDVCIPCSMTDEGKQCIKKERLYFVNNRFIDVGHPQDWRPIYIDCDYNAILFNVNMDSPFANTFALLILLGDDTGGLLLADYTHADIISCIKEYDSWKIAEDISTPIESLYEKYKKQTAKYCDDLLASMTDEEYAIIINN